MDLKLARRAAILAAPPIAREHLASEPAIRVGFKAQSRPPPGVYFPREVGRMLQQVNETEARDLKWSCQAVSPMDEPCDSAATFRCSVCGRWFCAVHASDEGWHTCVLEPGDEGGEA